MLYKIVLFPFFLISISYSGQLQMRVHNVGQGNCVCVNCPQTDTVLLVDCGSKEHTHRDDPFPPISIEAVKQSIMQLSVNKRITVIITHLDEDHYKWLPKMFNSNADKECIERVLIIGDEDSFIRHSNQRGPTGKLIKWIESLRTLPENPKTVTFYSNYNDPTLQAALPSCGESAIERPILLAANVCNQVRSLRHCKTITDDQNVNKNVDSLVMKLNHGACSTILPADAEGVTTDNILENRRSEAENTTVLLVPHHGSAKEHANSEEWIDAVGAKVAFFSAGTYTGYYHPQFEVIQRFHSPPILNQLEEHSLSFYEGSEPGELKTRQGLLNTLNAGNITVYFLENGHFVVESETVRDLLSRTPCVTAERIVQRMDEEEKVDEGVVIEADKRAARGASAGGTGMTIEDFV